MAVTGYNPSTVINSINNVDAAYASIMKALVETNQNTFITPMGAIWGSPQAHKFFVEYEKAITEMSNEVSKVFRSVVDAMNSAATSLANIAGSSWSAKEISSQNQTIDISCIKVSLSDGTIGIDQTQATAIAAQLDSVLTAVNAGLQEARNAVSNSGFVGGEMQNSLLRSLTTIYTNVANQFSSIKSQVTQAIQETADMYTTTSTNVSSAFGGGN